MLLMTEFKRNNALLFSGLVMSVLESPGVSRESLLA